MKDTVVRILRDEKLLDEARLEECLGIEKETGQTLDRVLLQKGYLTEGDILRVFSRALGMPMVESLGDEQVPAEFVNRVPVNFARNYGLVAIGRENGTVRVATASPLDTYPLDGYQHVLLYHRPTKLFVPLAKLKNTAKAGTIYRVDIHARTTRDGRTVCLDSSHEDLGRQMYLIPIGHILDNPPRGE